MPSAEQIASDRPVSSAWITYSTGARNMKLNSIGSVTPVRNDGQRHREQQAADDRAALLRRFMEHRETRGRQAEHHDREEAGHEAARGRIAREEAMQVARAPPRRRRAA